MDMLEDEQEVQQKKLSVIPAKGILNQPIRSQTTDIGTNLAKVSSQEAIPELAARVRPGKISPIQVRLAKSHRLICKKKKMFTVVWH